MPALARVRGPIAQRRCCGRGSSGGAGRGGCCRDGSGGGGCNARVAAVRAQREQRRERATLCCSHVGALRHLVFGTVVGMGTVADLALIAAPAAGARTRVDTGKICARAMVRARLFNRRTIAEFDKI